MTVDELIEKITMLQHKESVYSEAIAYLEEFLPSDVADEEDPDPIASPGCVVPHVPFEIVETVLEELCVLRDNLSSELNSLKSMEIEENDRSKRDSKSGKQRKRG